MITIAEVVRRALQRLDLKVERVSRIYWAEGEYYAPLDVIRLYKDATLEVLFHELIHASGHSSRLARDIIMLGEEGRLWFYDPLGDPDHREEERTAYEGAKIITNALGIKAFRADKYGPAFGLQKVPSAASHEAATYIMSELGL